jgi:hypothetical protein
VHPYLLRVQPPLVCWPTRSGAASPLRPGHVTRLFTTPDAMSSCTADATICLTLSDRPYHRRVVEEVKAALLKITGPLRYYQIHPRQPVDCTVPGRRQHGGNRLANPNRELLAAAKLWQ